MNEKQGGDWSDVDPAFDGHLEKPLLDMTPDELWAEAERTGVTRLY